MRHTTILGVLLRLHIFIFLLLVLGMLLYAVGGFQGFLASTQANLLRFNQYLSIAALLSGAYVVLAALVSYFRGRRHIWKTILGVLLSSLLSGGITVMTLFLQAMIVAA